MLISSRQNPKIKTLVDLRRRKDRLENRVTLVDGYDELSIALKNGAKVKEIYYCPELMRDRSQIDLLQKLQHADFFELSRAAFERAAYREGPDGWLAVCESVKTDLGSIKLSAKPLILVCEAVEKPGNLGAMLRTANAAGFDAVVAVDSITDWSNPNIVRSSKGAIFCTPVADITSAELLVWLKSNNIKIVTSTPDTEMLFTDVDMKDGVALFVGTEKYGLTDFWLKNADYKAKIPMVGQVDSLNAATSGALFMYEAVRQRMLK